VTPSSALRRVLSDRYDLRRVVGRGGMATVYLARDLRHGRDVAVKVLRPEISASVGADRFLNEIEIAARLTHPHIVPLFDSGQADGFLYYVMPYISGSSLRTQLEQDGPPDPATVVSIVAQVARALDYARRNDVIHRDIKPENILLADGHAFVTDFGIAKAVTAAGGQSFTRTGFALGTPGYMSPEQAAGVRELDVRSDIYGLGCVAYEMLVGETPGLWPSQEATRLGRFVDASASHRERLDALPGRIEQVLARALAMRPEDRFATPIEFADRLTAAFVAGGAFRPAEVDQIIARAAQIQARRPAEEGLLTIGALEQVGAEVGIAPGIVREAMHELGRAPDDGEAARSPSPSHIGYDDREVQRILERAIAIDAERVARESLLSHTDLQELAVEIGLLPEHLDEAVRELADAPPATPSAAPSRPGDISLEPSKTVRIERTVPGELTEAGHALIVHEIRGVLGIEGELTREGSSLTWRGGLAWSGALSSPDATRDVRVTVTTLAGQTHFRLEERVGSAPGRALGAIAGALAGAAIGLSEPSVALAAFFGIMLAAIGAVAMPHAILAGQASQSEHELRTLADRLGGVASRALEGTSPPMARRPSQIPSALAARSSSAGRT